MKCICGILLPLIAPLFSGLSHQTIMFVIKTQSLLLENVLDKFGYREISFLGKLVVVYKIECKENTCSLRKED